MDRHDKERTLTDADIEAITNSLRKKIITSFYLDVGKGVWSIAWKVILIGLLFLAAYGAHRGL